MYNFLKRHRPEAVVLIALITLITAATLSSSHEQQGNLLDLSSPIATVNGTEISYSFFYNMVEARVGFETLQNLVIYEIVRAEADRLGIEVSDEAIDEELGFLIQYQFGSEENFLNQLSAARMTLGELRSQIWIELACREIAMSEVSVTEDEVKAFFNQYKAQLYDKGERVEVRQILTATAEEANAIIQEIKAGGKFEEIAAAKSLDTATKYYGGYIGAIERGLMVEEFEEAAFNAEKGAVVGPVKTSYGYHIIEVLDKLDPEPAVFEDYKDEATYDLKSTRARSTDSVLVELVANADVTVTNPDYQGLVDLINGLKQAIQGTQDSPAE
jgi:foldase protein PrsA